MHWVPISPVACIISPTSPDKPGALSFHLFQCCSNFIDPDAICWSFLTPADMLWSHSFFSFIGFSMYSNYEPLIPFSSTITLPHTPFRQFDPVISCLFYHLLCSSKNLIWWLVSFKSFVHSFVFFFAKEITLFAFCLLFFYSFHVSVDFSFFQFPYFFFFSLTASATSSFHHHVSLWLHGPFDNPHVTCTVSVIIFFICHCFFYIKVFPLCFRYLICLQCFDAVGWASGRASGL